MLSSGFNAVDANETTPVTVVSAPGSGVSRLVSLTTAVNTDIASRTLRLYIDDGADEYNVYYNGSLGAGTGVFYPTLGVNTPLVLESGYTLKAVSDAKTLLEIQLTASYADDSSDSGGSSPYHLAVGESDDQNWVTLLSGASGVIKAVRLLSFSNDDNITHYYHVAMYDTSNRYLIDYRGSAAGLVWNLLRPGHVAVIKNGWHLQVKCATAESTSPSYYTAHYLECGTDDSGRI